MMEKIHSPMMGTITEPNLSQNWDGSDWVNNDKYLFTYDGNNNLTEGAYTNWNGSLLPG